LEYALGYGWSVKGEYLYVKFDDYTTFTSPPFASNNIAPRNVKLYDNIFRAGMNYKFW
jgi:opacity protein-like surface antigen